MLCTKWLVHGIQSTIPSGKWNPIRLSRSGPDLSHLFFADDFVIFSKADLKHAIVLKEILNDFFVISGHQVNA